MEKQLPTTIALVFTRVFKKKKNRINRKEQSVDESFKLESLDGIWS